MTVTWEIRHGDALERLREMPAESVQCCVTSPPYYGLRDYGTGRWQGGDPECDHGVRRWEGPKQTQGAQSSHASTADCLMRQSCACGAVRVDGQIGLESSLDQYVISLVGVFDEVRRVLRKDGTLWLNLGDSYAGSWGAQGHTGQMVDRGITAARSPSTFPQGKRTGAIPEGANYKPKDLIGVPWTVAFALRADGWYLRSDIIWAKPNPMPESVTDRPTSAHEHLFLLAKSPRYFYDADAIREDAIHAGKTVSLGPKSLSRGQATGAGIAASGNGLADSVIVAEGRNKRNVWKIATQPYSEAHFATFPPKLVEPCVLAGSAEGDTVLDPFNGAGTTGLVALRNDRSYIGIELNPEYVEMSRQRIRNDAPLLNTVTELR